MYLNYKRNAKFLGVIDYKSLVIIVAYIILIFLFVRVLPFDMEILIYIFMILVIPVISIFCININNESTVDVLLIILDFIINKKVFTRIDYIKDFTPCIFNKEKEFNKK